MRNITRVGVDLAKNLIQVHAVDAAVNVADVAISVGAAGLILDELRRAR